MPLTFGKMFQFNVSTAIILIFTTLITANLMFVRRHFVCSQFILTAYFPCKGPLGLTSLSSQ